MAYTDFTDNESILSGVSIKPITEDLCTTIYYHYKKKYSDSDAWGRLGLVNNAYQSAFFGKDYQVWFYMPFIRDDRTADLIANRLLSRRALLRLTATFSTILAGLQNDLLDEIDLDHYSGPSLSALTINSITIDLDNLSVEFVGKTENSGIVILDEDNLIILDENNRPLLSE